MFRAGKSNTSDRHAPEHIAAMRRSAEEMKSELATVQEKVIEQICNSYDDPYAARSIYKTFLSKDRNRATVHC